MLNERLHRTIAEAAGFSSAGDVQVLQCSSSGATGAIILHAWVGREKTPRLVVKTPREPGLRHAVSREWTTMVLLHEEARLAAMIPSAKTRFSVDGADYFAYEGVPGRTMFATYRNRPFTSRSSILRRFSSLALDAAVSVHSTRTRLAGPEEVAADLLVDLAWLESQVSSLPASISERGRTCAAIIAAAGQPLPHGRVHGDFSPYNLMIQSTRPGTIVRAIDWEHSEAERPQHLDLFRFISTCALMARRGVARGRAFQQMRASGNPLLQSLYEPWLARMNVPVTATWREPAPLQALWWHYCLHAARREQERRAEPADFRESTFLRGLAESL